jgi:hypothetical protein
MDVRPNLFNYGIKRKGGVVLMSQYSDFNGYRSGLLEERQSKDNLAAGKQSAASY